MKNIKYISIITISIIILLFMNLNVYALETRQIEMPEIRISIEQKELQDNKLQVDINIAVMENIEDGINAYSGELNFNSEELEIVEMKGTEKWNSPTYGNKTLQEGKTKIVSTSNQFLKEEGPIFSVIFKKKIDKSNYDIKFINFEVAAKINDETVKVKENIQTSDIVEEEMTENNIQPELEDTNKQKVGTIIAPIVVIVLLIIGILSIGFGIYRKKGGK